MARHGGGDRQERAGRIGYKVIAGGGMGRTPYIAHVMSEFVEREDILAYLEAVLRVYNQDSRRDNIHKQRIKILINAIGAGGNAPPRRARIRRDQGARHAAIAAGRTGPHRRLFRAARNLKAAARCHSEAGDRDFENWAKTNIHRPSRARLCHRHHLPQEPSARCRATPAPSRWTPSPI